MEYLSSPISSSFAEAPSRGRRFGIRGSGRGSGTSLREMTSAGPGGVLFFPRAFLASGTAGVAGEFARKTTVSAVGMSSVAVVVVVVVVVAVVVVVVRVAVVVVVVAVVVVVEVVAVVVVAVVVVVMAVVLWV